MGFSQRCATLTKRWSSRLLKVTIVEASTTCYESSKGRHVLYLYIFDVEYELRYQA